MTLILRKKDTIPISVTGGLSTVAIRIPSHPVARILLETTNLPIAAPSANISGKPSSTTFENVLHDFKGRVDVIIDGGDASISLESTVIDMTSDIPIILRPGSITQSMIEQVLKTSVLDQSEILIDNVPKAPGMKYKHYAPMATLKVIRGSNNAVKAYLLTKTKTDPKIAVLGPTNIISSLDTDIVIDLGSLDNMNIIAKNLFSAFRQLDQLNIKEAYIVAIPEIGVGKAIMNRIMKAANHQVIDI
ncbi:MAG: L-threonylcarbamoyladenylate synthase [Erysipelotrichaceae bacterium]|nr:L-threonylcarbamoyladenylate synthase [Erysipelotrichaceae bacterium]